MDASRLNQEHITDLDEKVEPQHRSEARPYISHSSLILTGRAIKRDNNANGHDLILSFAGDHEDLQRANRGERKRRIRCQTKSEAQRTHMLLMADLRKCKTDYQYNQVLIAFLTGVREAQMSRKAGELASGYVHVHQCPTLTEEGGCGCGFEWRAHSQTIECPCGTSLGDFLPTGQRFVLHDPAFAAALVVIEGQPNAAVSSAVKAEGTIVDE
jgi:hypothetical protein